MKFFNFGKKRKVGLALGGGGARGIALLGVLKAFEENNIKFDYVCGTSVGSLVGAVYAAGKKVNEIIEFAKTVTAKEVRTSRIPFMPSNTSGIEQILIRAIGDVEFKELNLPFCAVAVDIKTGNELHIKKGRVATAVAGSCAYPGFFSPVKLEEHLLFDGGLLNVIPADVPKLNGCNYVVAVDLNCTRGYGTESTKYLDLMIASLGIVTKSSALKGYLNADVMIKPDLKKHKSTKLVGEFDELVEEGYKAAMHNMLAVKQLMGIEKTKKIKHKKIKEKAIL